MLRVLGEWTKWAISDNRGFFAGIRDDAPEWAKEQYKEYLKPDDL